MVGKVGLKREYIKVSGAQDAKTSFGGNQAWFEKEYGNVSGQGCGVIAAIDAGLYLAGTSTISLGDYKELAKIFENINRFSVSFMKERFGKAIGIVPFQMCNYINKRCHGYRAKWNGIHGHKNMLEKMETMLAKDIPVIWGIYSYRNKVPFYAINEAGRFVKATSVSSHYVNAISIRSQSVAGQSKTMVEISSWGRCYYVDYDEYLTLVGDSLISKYCSNIVNVRKI